MGIRTGKEYLQSLNDGRELYLGNELVKDLVNHPAFKYTARMIARCYDLQHSKQEELTFVENGERFGNIWLPPRSKDDFTKIRRHILTWHEFTAGCLGRLHDYLGVWITTLYIMRDVLGRENPKYALNMAKYYEYCRSGDLALTHAISTPQIDRGPGAGRKENEDIHVVDVNDKGIVIEGARTVSTYAPYANEFISFPQLPANPDEDKEYVTGFALPMNTKGLIFICREPYATPNTLEDHPLSTLYDEMDCQVIFDRVLVPWDRVFLYGSQGPKINFEVFDEVLGAACWQATIKNIAKLRFIIGLVTELTAAFGTDAYPNVQERAGWLIEWHNILNAAVEGAELLALNHNGYLIPNLWYTWPLVMVFGSHIYPYAVETLRILSGSGVIMHPSVKTFDNDKLRKILEQHFRARAKNAEERIQLFKLIADMTINQLGGRMLQYERYFAADPFRVAVVHFRFTDKTRFRELVKHQLDLIKEMKGEK